MVGLFIIRRNPSVDGNSGYSQSQYARDGEVTRGCGRGCKFVMLHFDLYAIPVEKVQKEIRINMKYGGLKNAWIHSDDIFVYGLNPRTTKNMQPNREAIEELCKGIMETGVEQQ